jgi:hypothetical protein
MKARAYGSVDFIATKGHIYTKYFNEWIMSDLVSDCFK